MIRTLTLQAGLKADGRLLDMGCGCGAIPLVMRAHGSGIGSYVGLDVDRRMIDWCTRHLANESFTFGHHDYWSGTYNPTGQRFIPFAVDDKWADTIIMKSVLTHLLPDDTDWYLRETARVLTKGGTAILTVVLYDKQDSAILQRFKYEGDDGEFRFERPESPESSIALSKLWMDKHMSEAGLTYEYSPGTRQGSMFVRHL